MRTIQIRLTKELIKKAQNLVDKGLYSNKSEVVRDALRRLVLKDELLLGEKKFTILFSADLHGNIVQYNKLFKKAFDEKVEAVIIGGDIAPKDPAHRTVKDQKQFLEKELVPLIKQFNENNKVRNHSCSIYVIMGNDDFKSNYPVLKKHEKEAGFILIHNRCVKLHENFKIAGYSYVPLTPFIYKDWEKLDLIDETEYGTRNDFLIRGKKIRANHFVEFKFDLNDRNDTIEHDLRKLLVCSNPEKMILVSHSPPHNTCLDVLSSGEHVGSVAVRRIIEEKQPYIALHSHIHETVNISGRFMEMIKQTVCISPGNDPVGNSLAVIKFNLYDPREAKREII